MKKIKKFLTFSVITLAFTSVAACNTAGTYDVDDRREVRPLNVNDRYNNDYRGLDMDRTNTVRDRGLDNRRILNTRPTPGMMDRPLRNDPEFNDRDRRILDADLDDRLIQDEDIIGNGRTGGPRTVRPGGGTMGAGTR